MPTYTTLSKRQYALLERIESLGRMNIAGAQKLHQTTFGSLYHRGWISYSLSAGFHLSREGRQRWDEFRHAAADIMRHDPTRPLSHYFDPVQYGLKGPYRRQKLRLVKPDAA